MSLIFSIELIGSLDTDNSSSVCLFIAVKSKQGLPFVWRCFFAFSTFDLRVAFAHLSAQATKKEEVQEADFDDIDDNFNTK